MNRALLSCVFALIGFGTFGTAGEASAPRERLNFNAGWRFARFGPMPEGLTRAEPAGLETPAADDAAWRSLNLPHDWGIEGPFRADLPNMTAKLPWAGIGWYRKLFIVPAADRGRRVFLDLDGAMSHAQVWCNGRRVGEWPYGYSSFRLELTPFLNFGGDNLLAVRLDNPPKSSRWYPGGGLYRNVWLVKTAPVHAAHWGVFVTTPEISAGNAVVDVRTTVDNQTDSAAVVTVSHEIRPASGPARSVARAEQTGLALAAGTSADSHVRLSVPSPALWDVATPNLYVVHTTIRRDGQIVDAVETTFGIRTIAFDPEKGFMLNGRHVRFQGVCLHSDLGPLGTAFNVRAAERQLELLREAGCNAIRTAHNPPAPELLELCDRMGFLVMDEAFDAWGTMARDYVPNDYSNHFAQWHERDVQALVRRDRNHPSVIIWGSGNEVADQRQPGGVKVAEMLRRIFRREDPTRPVAGNLSYGYAARNGFAKGFDLIGRSYKPHLYAEDHALEPTRPVYGSETVSTLSSRGEYFFPAFTRPPVPFADGSTLLPPEEGAKVPGWRHPGSFFPPAAVLGDDGTASFQISSYDTYHPPWASTPDQEFAAQDRHLFVMGEFVWTGFDYLGEPTPYDGELYKEFVSDPDDLRRIEASLAKHHGVMTPRSSYFGLFDLAGFRKDRFHLYQARWRPELPMAHILPHWTWPERVGQVTPVHVYSSGDEAELFLNGKSLGRQKRGPFEYRFRWDEVKYAPGELKVVTWKNGQPWAEAVQRTAGAAARLTLSADRTTLRGDGTDLVFVTVRVEDATGLLVPRANHRVSFTVTGPADLVATDNGDATRLEPFQSPVCAAYNGLALAIVRPRPGSSGKIIIRATSDGLEGSEVSPVVTLSLR